MTGQELVDFINVKDLGNKEIEAEVYDKLFRVDDAVFADGWIRLYLETMDETMDRETVISHLQIIHTWATFALEHMDENFFKEKHMQKIAEWTKEALDLLKKEKK